MLGEEGSWIISEEPDVASNARRPRLGGDESESLESEGLEFDSLAAEGREVETGWRETLAGLVEGSRRKTLVDLVKESRRLLLGLAFLVGLVLGWIVIGRWLWPANRNADPWDLRRQHQANYVSLVAEDYWRSKDALFAKDSLAGWDQEELTDLLAEMASQAPSSEERQRLTTLAKVLQLPDYRVSLVTSFLLSKGILLSFVLSVSPLIVALVVVVSPLIGRRTGRGALPKGIDELLLPEDPELLEEMMRQGLVVMGPDGEPVYTPDGEPVHIGADGYGDDTEQYGEGTGEPGEEDLEKDDDYGEEDWEEWDDEEEIEKEGAVADILLDLFEDDEESFASLEALARPLPEIGIDDVLQTAQEIVNSFQTKVRRAA